MKTWKRFTLNQMGALVALTMVTLWALMIFWTHFTRPLGLEFTEVLFLGALVPVYVILVPCYTLRLRWSYISGIIFLLGFLVGWIKSLADHTYFFSLSGYNLLTVVMLLAAIAGINFSLRAYRELPPNGYVGSIAGVGGTLVIAALVIWQISSNQMRIENFILEQVIKRVHAHTERFDTLDGKIDALMEVGDIPAMTAAIVVGDEILQVQGYGEATDVDRLYNIGSVTKSFIATAVLQLYEQGVIDLDDDVNQYLPFEVRHPQHPDTPITLRMLLANRSCLGHNTPTYYAFSRGSALQQWGVENRGWEDHPELESIAYPDFMAAYLQPGGEYYQPENWVDCRPGTQFVYSTPGFDLLGYLVEQVNGRPLQTYLEANIFAPLEMSSTTTTPLAYTDHLATPYERWYGVLAKTNVILPYYQRRIIGGGGLYVTAGDLANFLQAHMNQGTFQGYQLLQPETIQMMHGLTSQASEDLMQVGYGYGWSLHQDEPRQMWAVTYQPHGFQGHGGRDWGYAAAMYMVSETQGAYGYVLLMNLSLVESQDSPWVLSTQMLIQDMLLNEAYRRYQDEKVR